MPFFDRVAYIPGDPADADRVSTGAPGVLRIEPDQVDAAIGIFEDALEKLRLKVEQARNQVLANPMAEDGVSQPAAAAFNRASFDGPGAATAAWSGAVDELESIIRQLRASKEAIVQADEILSNSFSSAASAMG